MDIGEMKDKALAGLDYIAYRGFRVLGDVCLDQLGRVVGAVVVDDYDFVVAAFGLSNSADSADYVLFPVIGADNY